MKGPNLSFDHESTSDDAGIDSQMSWNSMQTSPQNRLPDYHISSSETNIQYLQHVRHEGRIAEWSLGETSSSTAQHQGDQNERKIEHAWTLRPRATLPVEELQYEPSNILSLDNADVSSNGHQPTNGSFLLQNSSINGLPHDLNMSSAFGDQEDNECQVGEHPSSYISIGSSNELVRPSGNSSDSFGVPFGSSGYVADENGDRPGCSLDGRRMSCKRKALEVHAGQSSGMGSSNYYQNAERSQWQAIPAAQVAASSVSLPKPTENDVVTNDGSELANPRLRLGAGGSVSPNPFSLTASGNAQSSRRNFRLRINGLHQQNPIPQYPFSTTDDIGNMDVSSSRHSSRLGPRNRPLDLNPPPAVENGSLRGQPVVLQVPSVRRNHQSRWSGASSTRSGSSSAPAIPEERNAAVYEEAASRNIPRSISEHPMFLPASEVVNSSQNSINWNMTGGNNSISGNVASTSRVGSIRGANSAAPSWSHRTCPQYPRRISELVRRSLLSSAGIGHGGQSSNNALRSSSSTTSQEMVPGLDNHGQRASNSRSALLERHLEGAFGIPYSLRTLAAAGDGRSSIMSEIRHVLDLMRRGEGLRFEDVMVLDHSVLFGMADIHDRHRDMRLDVDNMSYEELLALEERIGNVCTGLNEVTIMSRLKQQKYVDRRVEDQVEREPCSICREEYNHGEDLGTLECGHDFHIDCIKQWLMQKNLCPICKTTGLTTT